MFSYVLSVLGEGRREALLDEARRERLARDGQLKSRKRPRPLARAALYFGRALIALSARL